MPRFMQQSGGLFCEAFATLNVGVRVTITCHDLCNNRDYSEQLYRYHNAIDERQPDLWSDTDPPF